MEWICILRVQQRELLSVGVDIGSSTSHVVFSKLTLEKNRKNPTEKFEIIDRRILYSGPIHLTPFRDQKTIDFDALKELLLEDYKTAGIAVTDVDTGAVIITGETAKKENAEWIVNELAGETGKFVAATAGPNFEAVLAAYGSGSVARSAENGKTIMNVDIGGGSSNIAICTDGRIIATAALNVGGRLIATDQNGIIIRLEETGKKIASLLGLKLELGEELDSDTKEKIADELANALIDGIQGKTLRDSTRLLMMTPPLIFEGELDTITFSGGVAEYYYDTDNNQYNDLGYILSQSIKKKATALGLPIGEPDQRIRATVIGAGHFSLQVSGSTTFLSSGLGYPLRNLPVVVPYIQGRKSDAAIVQKAIDKAIKRFDLREGVDPMILAFKDAVRPSYENLLEFAKGVVAALPETISNNKPILMCFDTDIGNSVGNIMRRETGITNEILSIDEISLREGDFIDIGAPVIEDVVVPVVVKTLVFDVQQK
ncbi:ethanolamine utilization protein EutA [Candidatus Thorarchaeota archaeon]|nr:MAG: ethanolamine utilization protein EutA [Candidatus Thorarchaeota archaeon]